MGPKPTRSKPVCHIDDIPLNGSKAYRHQDQLVFGVKNKEGIYFYMNQCPHLGLPLEWQADQFLTNDKSMIQCATHGALFELDTGECVLGPCQGEHLTLLDIFIENEHVFVQATSTKKA